MKALIGGLIAASTLLSGCLTGERDSGGTVMQLTPPREIAFHETDLTVPLYLHPYIASVTQEIRDNDAPIDNYNLGDNGSIQTQRVAAFFTGKTEESRSSRGEFEERLADSSSGRTIAPDQIREINRNDNHRTRGYSARFSRSKITCIYARGGYRLGSLTAFDNEQGTIDTVIEAWACGEDALIDAMEQMLSGLDKVKDRAA